MPILVLEVEGRLQYQCACDRCARPNEPRSTEEEASQGFHEHPPGVYLCEACEYTQPTMSPEDFEERVARSIELARQHIPTLDIRPGSHSRMLIESIVMQSQDPDYSLISALVASQSMSTPLVRRLSTLPVYATEALATMEAGWTEMAQAAAGLHEALPRAGTPADKKAAKPLPAWCRPGQLVRHAGQIVRLRLVDQFGIRDVTDMNGQVWKVDDSDGYDAYEPVEAKTRWDLLDEED